VVAEALVFNINSFVRGSADKKDRMIFLYKEWMGVRVPDLTEDGIH
jgi:hypothetical protein